MERVRVTQSLHTMKADEVFAANHPNLGFYKYVLNAYHHGQLTPMSLEAAAVLLARPDGWATENEGGNNDPADTVKTKIHRFRKYLEGLNVGLTIWTIRSNMIDPPQNRYFNNKHAWFSTAYLIGDSTKPPQHVNFPIPYTTNPNEEVRQVYAHLFRSIDPDLKSTGKRLHVGRYLSGYEMIAANFLATHRDRISSDALSRYYEGVIDIYRDRSVLMLDIRTLARKIDRISPHIKLIYQRADNIYKLTRVD